MNFRIVNTILRKELLDTLRDKRTLLMMVGIPIILYPAMLLFGMQAVLVQQTNLERAVARVAFEASDPALFESWLRPSPKDVLMEILSSAEPPVDAVMSAAKFKVVDSADPDADLAAGKLEVVISVGGDPRALLDENASVPIEIRFDSTGFHSRDAAGRIQEALTLARERLQTERLKEAHLPESFIKPLDVSKKDVAPPMKRTGFLMGLILPVLMILTIALGAFYPAVDLTAGEKERGTFETLLSTPASKLEIVAGKFLTVFLLAMATGLLNLLSMAASFFFMISQVSSMAPNKALFQIQVPFQAFPLVLAAVVPLALFISALMMAVAVFARSFKEAQNYLTPFFIVITLPASIAGFPGVELGPISQFIPIANVILLFRGLMTGTVSAEALFAVFLSTILYAVLALLFAAWLFQREEVVLSEERGIPLTLRRREIRPRNHLTASWALAFFSLMIILIAFLGSVVQRTNMLGGLLVTEWGLIAAPTLLLLWFVRVRFRTALLFYRPSLTQVLGAVLMALGGMLLIIHVSTWQNRVLPLPEDMQKFFASFLGSGKTVWGLTVLLFAAALSPAVCEELLFRGALLTGLRQRLNPWACMLAVGLLFGLFHLSVYRVLPTGLIGVLLTYIALRSGSIVPGMVAHFVFNTLGILAASERLPAVLLESLASAEKTGLPWFVTAGALALLGLGVLLIECAKRPQTTDSGV